MSATWTPLDRNTHALRLAGARLTWYRLAGDVRSLTIQRAVVDRLLDERWRPTGEWATWIDGLTKREAAE